MKLLDQVRDVVRKKHYSIRTEQAYVSWIRKYILFHRKRHPKDMGEKEISQYLSYLASDQRVASSTQNQALNAIVFLYKHVLRIELGDLAIWKEPRGRRGYPKTPAVARCVGITSVKAVCSGRFTKRRAQPDLQSQSVLTPFDTVLQHTCWSGVQISVPYRNCSGMLHFPLCKYTPT